MTNRLANETSPYLRQHADNPVDWWPWGTDALEEAKRRNVPVLISVGYSACHWCHVMAHESFEDDATGELMNRLFVNVKVDREERPDVDAVYMDAVQAMNGHGGWPMTVFCLPDGRPFFAGTYFPKTSYGGKLGFAELCERINELWQTRREELTEQAASVTEAIDEGVQLPQPTGTPSSELFSAAATALISQIDNADGGFGAAPKFPQTFAIDLLLRHHARTGEAASLNAAVLSLDAMAAGGIYDHLGGGFARYATDRRWLIPHFEKMLYDQALLARVYLHAWQLTREPRFLQTLEETIDYVLNELRHPLGGFFSAEDADSEGIEGKFYVWSLEEIRQSCGADADAVIEWFGVTRNGNWERTNILERVVRGDLARPAAVERGRQALFAARSQRVRPGLDDKVLTEWNALMLATIAEAAAATGNSTWLDAAILNANFLCDNLRVNGRWMRSWQGEARVLAFSADYGALIDAFVRLHEATGESRWIIEAADTADALLELFADPSDIGVYTNGNDGDQLVARPKELMDNATACANSLAAVGLLRLSALTGNHRHQEFAVAIVDRLTESAARLPLGFGHLLLASELSVLGIGEIVISGDRPDLVAEAQRHWTPRAVLTWGEPGNSPLWEGRTEIGTDGRAYVCRQMVCSAPASTIEEFRDRLNVSE
ncbi:MAG: thioredoxin domain-containing protein [Acidimicrobiales bacterium]